MPPPSLQEPDTYHRVLYNFSAQMEGDMTAAEGEVVLVVEKKSAEGDWVVVENSQVINMGSNILLNSTKIDDMKKCKLN